MENVHKYILDNWGRSVRDPKNEEDAKLSHVKLPNPYTTPCIDDTFKNFYYWDTYFTNLGLLEDGQTEQARNNLRIMKFFVKRYGFVPNADHLIFGSQPPLFTRGVYDLYQKTHDKNDISLFIDALIEEMDFWEFDRKTECGLNQYRCGWTNIACYNAYPYFANRVGGLSEEEKQIDRIEMAKNFYAIAESGWDINLRYRVKGNRFASLEFVNVDLNAILYDAENKLGELLTILGRAKDAEIYRQKANKRKELMNRLMSDESGILLDYNFKRNHLSLTHSAASFLPIALGVSDNREAGLKLFQELDHEYGISTAVSHGEEMHMQWDYPHMWPSNAYFAYLALSRVGLKIEAEKIKNQYIAAVKKNFEKTGQLWEKYNALDGSVSVTIEYKTPSMMGWTAGVFEYFYHH